MQEMIRLTAADGFELSAYRTAPSGRPRGGLVLCQEIFGVNAHIRAVADGYAADGYAVIAPALFDRITPGFEVGYDPASRQQAMAMLGKASREDAVKDVAAALAALAPHGRVGVLGFCWGGTIAWLSATRLTGLAAAVMYYAGGIAALAGETPKCPVLGHFGELDTHIPLDGVDKLRVHPEVELHTYPAGHGFNRDVGESYDRASAEAARARTLAFLARHVD